MKKLAPFFLLLFALGLFVVAQEPVPNLSTAGATPGQWAQANFNGATWSWLTGSGNIFTNFYAANLFVRNANTNTISQWIVFTNSADNQLDIYDRGGDLLARINESGYVGGGVGLTALNATELTSGTVPAARLLGVNAVLNLASATNYGGIQVYRATVSQQGTDAPVGTVMQNTLAGTSTFGREAAGVYYLTNTAGAFTANKTFVRIQTGTIAAGSVFEVYTANRTSANVIKFHTWSGDTTGTGGDGDDLAANAPLEILVYP